MNFSVNLPSNQFNLKAQSTTLGSSERSNQPVDVVSVSFDKELIYLVCPMPGWLPLAIREGTACSENQQRITIFTKTSATIDNGLTFYYTVSAGKIVGSGSKVIWDLSGNSPGRYSITAGVGKDNVISGKTLTKYVTVEECRSCDPPCMCPYKIEIKGPTRAVKKGDSLVFSADVEFGDRMELLDYVWKVTGGEIIEGQKTNQILVKANPKSAGEKISVTIEVKSRECDCGLLEANIIITFVGRN